jgi:hypothetical protein
MLYLKQLKRLYWRKVGISVKYLGSAEKVRKRPI